ncbi:MAG: hypothetical protein O2887_08070 [Bacteroidetes bacterium]|nr:hypothetical protein [Bacteroidota bacterium]MDA1120435.1 hypothetical protein [Bacteroidota bacterium]
MKPLNLSQQEVLSISQRHILSVDKMYRMHAGVSSSLTAVKEGIVYLEVNVNIKWLEKKSPLKTAKQFADSWRHGNKELRAASGYIVNIFQTNRIAGFTLPAKKWNSRLADELRKKMSIEEINQLIFVYREFYN